MRDLQVVFMTCCGTTVSLGVFDLKSDAETFVENLLATRELAYEKKGNKYFVYYTGVGVEIYTIESAPLNPTI